MMFLIYAIALIIILSLSMVAYKLCRRWGRFRAGVSAGLTFGVAILVWPIPFHGGFTFLFATIWHDISHSYQEHMEITETYQKDKFLSQLNSRFKAPLTVFPRQRLNPNWVEVQLPQGMRARLDESSKMLWSEPIALEPTAEFPSLDSAKSVCSELPPLGHWALPTEAEYYTIWRSGGTDVLSHTELTIVSYIVDEQFELELPTFDMRKKSVNRHTDAASPTGSSFAVRCVARTANAPERGYIKSDIPLDEWNRYQLQKLSR